jgi:hypothetical protein
MSHPKQSCISFTAPQFTSEDQQREHGLGREPLDDPA